MSEMDEIVSEFLVESHENLDVLNQELVALEQDATPERLAAIFRTMHTIKGTSGFLGFTNLERLTHVAENLLSRLRDGVLSLSTDMATALLRTVDAVQDILAEIEATGTEPDDDFAALIAVLERLNAGDAAAAHAADPGEPGEPGDRYIDDPSRPDASREPDTDAVLAGELLIATGKITREQLDESLARQAAGDPRHVGELLLEQGALSPDDIVDTLRSQQDTRTGSGRAESSIRVDVGLLDVLMNLVGELVLARNQILQFTQTQTDTAFLGASQRLNLITTELQEGVMKTRMQPIENVWSKFPRVVRDLAVACEKDARLVMDGKDTELDKTILEAIKDPLTHLVRNAVDHGLERPAERERAGKPAQGTVTLRAYHEGGQVNIEISDDGAGIDPARVKRSALEKGVVTADQVAQMTPRDLINLVFEPGFSTAERVSNISGRGVGMDVVRTNIESIGGTIDVQSRVGLGTTFKIKIPLTLAIIPALIVTCRGDHYAIPQVSLLELVRLDGSDPASRIERINDIPVYRLRGRLLPLGFLDAVFNLEAIDLEACNERSVNIVVLQADDQQFGLVVDDITDTAEIVVKPLGKLLKTVPYFAGATIMGDGRVALILDVLGVAESLNVSAAGRDAGLATLADLEEGGDAGRRTLLLFRLADRRLALLLEMVARLEEFAPDRVEVAGEHRVVQYRDEILPLVYLREALGIGGDEPAVARTEGSLHVVVFNDGERNVGLVVDEITDIVEQALEITTTTSMHGVLGSAVIQGRVTDVLDIEGVIAEALPRTETGADR